MERLALCADEHVPDAYVTALRSNGFTVARAADARGESTDDDALLEWCAGEGYVLLTNDRDFVRLGDRLDHAGLALYTTQKLTAGEVTRGIRRVDRQFTPGAMENTLVWLDNWV